jgi:hypothetical protein
MNNTDDNIFFFLEEKIEEKDNSFEIEKMLNELEDTDDTDDIINYNLTNIEENTNIYFSTKKIYEDKYGINNEEFYQDYNLKQLLRICNYYDIEKNVKMAKYKKQDIISSIVYFESLPENAEIVNNRHRMWSYVIELMHDSKMKKYIIWS